MSRRSAAGKAPAERSRWERFLLRLMGPPQVGPYEDTPDPAVDLRAQRERELREGGDDPRRR